MINVFYDLLRFTGYSFILVLAVVAVSLVFLFLGMRARHKPQIEVRHLNKNLRQAKAALLAEILEKKAFKKWQKNLKLEKTKMERKAFVLDFKGDIQASEVESLRQEITLVLSAASPGDEVILRLESPGGLVHTYGLAAAQLMRLREASLNLTICVDRVAASGGYMMACVAHKIWAAPFAIIGSIGVIAQVPNFNKILKKNDVEYHEITAGEFKRTLTLFGEVTDKKIEKFAEQIEKTHVLFKDFVETHRPQLNIPVIATGEHWYGQQALALNLVDGITTSDDYLLKTIDTAEVYQVSYHVKKKMGERLSKFLLALAGKAIQFGLSF